VTPLLYCQIFRVDNKAFISRM